MDFQAFNAFDEWTLNPNFSYDVDEDEESDFEDFIDEIIYNEELGVQVKKEKKRRDKNKYLDIDPKATVWYFFYILYPDTCNQKFNKLFRRRFRMPYQSFRDLLDIIKADDAFCRWHDGNMDSTKKPCSPIGLLLLGSLRYLGRGFTFDDLYEATGISEEVHRRFFHVFIQFGSTVLYNRYVNTPSNVDEAKQHSSEYSKAGLSGAIGSMDGVHILMDRCEASMANEHISHKMKQTARAFNVIVNN